MLSGLFASKVLSGKLPSKKEINQGGNFKSQSINEAAARKFFSTLKKSQQEDNGHVKINSYCIKVNYHHHHGHCRHRHRHHGNW